MKWKLLFIPLILAAIGVLAAVVMLLWNWVVPGLFAGASPIDYWRALGLLVLCRILFGGLRGHHGHHHGGARERWRKWHAMTPEEREQFHQSRNSFCRPSSKEE